jgi:hypothetical protein
MLRDDLQVNKTFQAWADRWARHAARFPLEMQRLHELQCMAFKPPTAPPLR